MDWRPIETAPKDGTHVLAWVDDLEDGCPKCGEDGALCLYHAHADGLSVVPSGYAIVEWGGGFDDRTWEYPNEGWLPDWWFRVGSDYEEAANPTHWMPMPDPPKMGGE